MYKSNENARVSSGRCWRQLSAAAVGCRSWPPGRCWRPMLAPHANSQSCAVDVAPKGAFPRGFAPEVFLIRLSLSRVASCRSWLPQLAFGPLLAAAVGGRSWPSGRCWWPVLASHSNSNFPSALASKLVFYDPQTGKCCPFLLSAFLFM